MAKPRIATKPSDVRDQITQAASGISNELNWPATAPTEIEVDGLRGNLISCIAQVNDLKSQLAQARATLHAKVDACIAIMKRVDEVTDGLYGSDGAEKNNFGLPPKKSTAGVAIPLSQVLITKIEAGTAPASLFVDWDTDAGARAYEMEWYTDSAMTQRIGNVSTTVSEYEILGLIAGQQYWVRIRSLSGSEYGQWSDPATFMANL
ncbi:MAG: fibronectin type III domain-containing protein [Planctomycetes bacterium]|nr:fibronectin type III domain-containing protein [Planctomycetota bacterium]